MKGLPRLAFAQPLRKMRITNSSLGLITVWIAIISFSSSITVSSLISFTGLGFFGMLLEDVLETSLTTLILAQTARELRLNCSGTIASPSGDTKFTFALARLLGDRLQPRCRSLPNEIRRLWTEATMKSSSITTRSLLRPSHSTLQTFCDRSGGVHLGHLPGWHVHLAFKNHIHSCGRARG